MTEIERDAETGAESATETHVDPAPPASSWWSAALSRREAHKMTLGVAAAASVAGVVGCDDDSKVVELDALAAQKKGGWDVGDAGKKLVFQNVQSKDARKGMEWQSYKDPKKLLSLTTPSDPWKPYAMPTLIQALEQKTLAAQMKPTSSKTTVEAFRQGGGLASLLGSTENPEKTLLLIDAPGPVSVAAAAGMAATVEPIFWFDSWPHPKGVVPAHQTLGSLLYYASAFEVLKKKRAEKDKVAHAIVLDANRLNTYSNPDKQFDNRYAVTLPEPEQLKKLGVETVIYVTANEKSQELDDINDYAVAYQEAGIHLNMLALSAFQKDPEYDGKMAEQAIGEAPEQDPANGYYYGGARTHHTHFFVYYPFFAYRPMYYGPTVATRPPPPSRVRKPAYSPKPRKTLFSGRKTGGASGVGRRRPTGFGRVSTRQSSSGKIMGTRSGSTGRFRSGSRGFGG